MKLKWFFLDGNATPALLARLSRKLSIEGEGEAGGGGDPGDEHQEFDVMDHEQRTNAAMEFLNEPAKDEDEPGAQKTAEEIAAAAAAAGEGQREEQKLAEAQEAKVAELRELPEFKELESFKGEVQEVLDSYGIPDNKELRAQLDDSHVLYQIMNGAAPVSKLLDVAINNPGWTPEQKQALGQGLVEWLQANKFLETGAAAAGEGKDGKKNFDDPLAKRVNQLESERKTAREAQEAEKTKANQQAIFNKYANAIEGEMKVLFSKDRLVLDAEELSRYMGQVTAKMQANPEAYKAIYTRISKGNFVDVKRFVSEVHAAELKRLQKHTQGLAATAGKKDLRNPRIAAGGGPAAPQGSATQRKAPMNRDERVAAGVAALNE